MEKVKGCVKALITGVGMFLLIMVWVPVAMGEQNRYNLSTYHEVHTKKAALHCEYCHVDPYKPVGWVKVDNQGVLRLTDPTNSKRAVDKQKCLECHRWGQKALYGGEPARAGDLYKK